LLYEVEPWDLTTMVAVCAMLFGVGVLAALLPARRATAADPMDVLRAD
jgi:ABC-type lipoprotein release transport system permease subunit